MNASTLLFNYWFCRIQSSNAFHELDLTFTLSSALISETIPVVLFFVETIHAFDISAFFGQFIRGLMSKLERNVKLYFIAYTSYNYNAMSWFVSSMPMLLFLYGGSV